MKMKYYYSIINAFIYILPITSKKKKERKNNEKKIIS